MKNKKKFDLKKNIGLFVSLLLGVIFGIVLGFFLSNFDSDMSWYEELLFPLYLIVVVYVSYIMQIIIHEAGHLVFGLLTGYKFCSFRIFSFMLVKENDKLKLKKFSLAGTAGQCLMIPPDMIDGKIPVILYNLGGSLFNIISSLAIAPIYFLCNDVPYLSVGLLIFIMFGIISTLSNGIPLTMGTVNNDGYNAISLNKNDDAMKSFWIQLKVNEQVSKGVRVKDMPDEWFVFSNDESMKNSMVASKGVFVCNRLMDMQKFDEADELMKHMLDIDSALVGLHRNLLICDRIYVELIKENRCDVIDIMLTKEQKSFMKSMKNYPTILRTQYALALIFEKNPNKAENIKKQFEKRVKSYPYQSEIIAEREFMTIAERVYDCYEKTSKTV